MSRVESGFALNQDEIELGGWFEFRGGGHQFLESENQWFSCI